MASEDAYRLVVVEDDYEQAQATLRALEAAPCGGAVSATVLRTAAELESYLAAEDAAPIDVLVADIELEPGEPTGIDLVQRHFPAGSGTQVIYLTAHMEYCTRVYQTEHVYFLTKPLVQGQFDDALAKALANVEKLRERPLAVRANGHELLLYPQKISYLESDRRKVRIHTGAEIVETYGSLADLARKLPASFVQCHKSFLVNMAFIAELRADEAHLLSGECVPVSQRRRKATHAAFVSYVRSL